MDIVGELSPGWSSGSDIKYDFTALATDSVGAKKHGKISLILRQFEVRFSKFINIDFVFRIQEFLNIEFTKKLIFYLGRPTFRKPSQIWISPKKKKRGGCLLERPISNLNSIKWLEMESRNEISYKIFTFVNSTSIWFKNTWIGKTKFTFLKIWKHKC